MEHAGNDAGNDPGIAPFQLVERSPGKHSLLLTTFEPAGEVFERHGVQGGGHAWEGVAKYVIAREEGGLAERVHFDPEASMFCAYGEDREALHMLGEMLAAVFRDPARLGEIIDEVGPEGFDD